MSKIINITAKLQDTIRIGNKYITREQVRLAKIESDKHIAYCEKIRALVENPHEYKNYASMHEYKLALNNAACDRIDFLREVLQINLKHANENYVDVPNVLKYIQFLQADLEALATHLRNVDKWRKKAN